jgi:hypothetical protein
MRKKKSNVKIRSMRNLSKSTFLCAIVHLFLILEKNQSMNEMFRN